MTAPIDFENLPSFDDLRAKLEKAGVSPREAIGIAGTYVLAVAGYSQRVFAYSKDLAATAPQCQSVFDPRFQHQPWIDGEDVVQAGQTPGGDIGFNLRFTNIEFDLKDLAQGLKDIYTCLATLRLEMSTLLGEIRAELNRINSDLGRAVQGGVVQPFPTKIGPLEQIKYLGIGKVLGKDVQIWETQQGTVVLPLLTTVAAVEVDNRVKRVADLGRIIQENADLKKKLDAAPMAKEDLIKNFGDVRTASGETLRDLVDILPANQQIANSANLVDLVAEREALALRTGPGRDFALANAFGVDENVDVVGAVAVEKFASVPVDARAALKAAGIDTMEKLAAADDKTLATALKKGGVPATASDSASWRAAAKALVNLG
jgi:hypothetical protein